MDSFFLQQQTATMSEKQPLQQRKLRSNKRWISAKAMMFTVAVSVGLETSLAFSPASDNGSPIKISSSGLERRRNRLVPPTDGHSSTDLGVTMSPVNVYSTTTSNAVKERDWEIKLQPVGKRRSMSQELVSLPATSKVVSPLGKRMRNSRMVSPKSLNSRVDGSSVRGASSSFDRPDLLSREEENTFTNNIRDSRRAIRIRDELALLMTPDQPTEQHWAQACDLSIGLLRRVMYEGKEARSVLVSCNVGLVTSIAKRHYNGLKQATEAGGGVGTILSLQDMIQEGNLGLIHAAERYEPERGLRFSTYATYWVRQRIMLSISDYSRIIRLPAHGEFFDVGYVGFKNEISFLWICKTHTHTLCFLFPTVHSMLTKINKARKAMRKEIGRDPSDPELAFHMEMSVDKLRKYTKTSRNVVSLELPVRSGGGIKEDRRTIGDFIASDAPTPEEDAQSQNLKRDIRAVIDGLANHERDVLVLRFGLDNGKPMTTAETAKQLEISRDRVRLVEAKALNKLRNPQRNYRLKEYVGGEHEEDHHPPLEKATSSPERMWFF
jgi:RNA polymerase primary sigma factor